MSYDILFMEVTMSLDQLIYEKIPSLSAGQRKVAEYILNNKDDLFMFGVNNTLNIIFKVFYIKDFLVYTSISLSI